MEAPVIPPRLAQRVALPRPLAPALWAEATLVRDPEVPVGLGEACMGSGSICYLLCALQAIFTPLGCDSQGPKGNPILCFLLSTGSGPSDVDGASYPGTHGHDKTKQGGPDIY